MSTNGSGSPYDGATLSSGALNENEKRQMTSEYLNQNVAQKQSTQQQPYVPQKLTFFGFIFLWIGTLIDGFKAFWKGILLRPRGLQHHRYFIYAGVRSFGRRNPDHIFEAFSRPTVDQTVRLAKKRGYNPKPTFVPLAGGATGIWIGPPNAKEVMLFFHGGGFSRAAAPSHISILWDCAAKARRNDKDFAVFALAYTLAPEAQYPVQLRQAVSSLKYLLETAKLDHSNIMLAGDSAGGNLVLALVSHLRHPHPLVPDLRLPLEQRPFLGMFLMCPWVVFDSKSRSAKKNEVSTYFDQKVLKTAKKRYLGVAGEDVYTTPLKAPPEWWTNLPFRAIGVVAGEFESFLDDIKAFVEKLKFYNQNVEFFVAPRETHDQPMFDKEAFPWLGMTKTEEYFQKWTINHLRSSRAGWVQSGVTGNVSALPGVWVDEEAGFRVAEV